MMHVTSQAINMGVISITVKVIHVSKGPRIDPWETPQVRGTPQGESNTNHNRESFI